MANRRKKDGSLNREQLLGLFEENKPSKVGKNDLCWLARDKGLITDEQCDRSLVREHTVIPCYMHTQILDLRVRELLDWYAVCYSRGSFIANLLAIQQQPDSIPLRIPLQPFCAMPTFLNDVMILKRCFLPERWLEKGLDIDPGIQLLLEQNMDLLQPYLPNYKENLCDTGWDNALNHMAEIYMGAIKVQTLTHLERRLRTYFEEHYACNQDTNKKSLVFVLSNPSYPTTGVHNDDFGIIMSIRGSFGVGHSNWLSSGLKELTGYTWSLHHWLVHRLSGSQRATSILPVSTINRKYAYLDYKVCNSLLPMKLKKPLLQQTSDHVGSELQKILGLTREMFNRRASGARKNKRRKGRTKKKWRDRGRGSLPEHAIMTYIETDGVGLRLHFEKPPKRPIPKEVFVVGKDAVRAGADTGRAKMITSTDTEGTTLIMGRTGFYRAQHHKQLLAWERGRMAGTAWGTALAAVAGAGGFKNADMGVWLRTLDVQGENMAVLLEEQMSIDRARQRMFRFRKKKSWMDQKMKKWLEPAHKRAKQMVIGLGDGKFPSGGKGELSVPTSGIQIAYKKALRVLNISRLVKIVPIDEYKTTKCCHRCGSVMQHMTTARGGHCVRYLLCTGCASTAGKRRNRDVNASKNILTLLEALLEGRPRPEHMRCPWRNHYLGLPPYVRTA